jgi:hypothetical protein
MSSYDSNPFYSPEGFDPPLVLEASLSTNNEAYEFGYIAVWSLASDRSKFFYATDAGCSCPTPFEDFNTLDDLTPIGETTERVAPEPEDWGHSYYLRGLAGEENFKDRLESYMLVTQRGWADIIAEAKSSVPTAQDEFYSYSYGSADATEAADFVRVVEGLATRDVDALNDPTVLR